MRVYYAIIQQGFWQGQRFYRSTPLPQATRRSCMPPGPAWHWFNTRPEQGTCTRCKDLRPTWNRGAEIWSPHSWCPSHFHVIKSTWPGTCPVEKPHHYNTIKTHDWTQTITRQGAQVPINMTMNNDLFTINNPPQLCLFTIEPRHRAGGREKSRAMKWAPHCKDTRDWLARNLIEPGCQQCHGNHSNAVGDPDVNTLPRHNYIFCGTK